LPLPVRQVVSGPRRSDVGQIGSREDPTCLPAHRPMKPGMEAALAAALGKPLGVALQPQMNCTLGSVICAWRPLHQEWVGRVEKVVFSGRWPLLNVQGALGDGPTRSTTGTVGRYGRAGKCVPSTSDFCSPRPRSGSLPRSGNTQTTSFGLQNRANKTQGIFEKTLTARPL